MSSFVVYEFTDNEFLPIAIFNEIDGFAFVWFEVQKVILVVVSWVSLEFLYHHFVLCILFGVQKSFQVIATLDFLLVVDLFIYFTR